MHLQNQIISFRTPSTAGSSWGTPTCLLKSQRKRNLAFNCQFVIQIWFFFLWFKYLGTPNGRQWHHPCVGKLWHRDFWSVLLSIHPLCSTSTNRHLVWMTRPLTWRKRKFFLQNWLFHGYYIGEIVIFPVTRVVIKPCYYSVFRLIKFWRRWDVPNDEACTWRRNAWSKCIYRCILEVKLLVWIHWNFVANQKAMISKIWHFPLPCHKYELLSTIKHTWGLLL